MSKSIRMYNFRRLSVVIWKRVCACSERTVCNHLIPVSVRPCVQWYCVTVIRILNFSTRYIFILDIAQVQIISLIMCGSQNLEKKKLNPYFSNLENQLLKSISRLFKINECTKSNGIIMRKNIKEWHKMLKNSMLLLLVTIMITWCLKCYGKM